MLPIEFPSASTADVTGPQAPGHTHTHTLASREAVANSTPIISLFGSPLLPCVS